MTSADKDRIIKLAAEWMQAQVEACFAKDTKDRYVAAERCGYARGAFVHFINSLPETPDAPK